MNPWTGQERAGSGGGGRVPECLLIIQLLVEVYPVYRIHYVAASSSLAGSLATLVHSLTVRSTSACGPDGRRRQQWRRRRGRGRVSWSWTEADAPQYFVRIHLRYEWLVIFEVITNLF